MFFAFFAAKYLCGYLIMDSEFEQRLRRQPMKPIPAEWRSEILSAAVEAHHASRIAHRSWLSTLKHQFSTLLWPHPVAWAGLAAAWMVIFALNLSMREKSPALADKTPPPSPEVLVELRQQHKLYAELIGIGETRDADRQRILSPKPRSERVEILAT